MLAISIDLVSRLVAEQFPQWLNLPIRAVDVGGWDNASFRLGDDMVIRLPRAPEYAAQVLKEHRWLPVLVPQLPLEIPRSIALGRPSASYPWSWAVLAAFLTAIRRVSTEGGPAAGPQSFHRGGSLDVYDGEVRAALARMRSRVDGDRLLQIWDEGRAMAWTAAPVWIHGDISVGNLLVRHGELVAVIDFGQLAVGDPACDLAIAWSLFAERSRESFRLAVDLDEGTWARGKAWALWKALITASGLSQTNAVETAQAECTLEAVVRDSA